MKILNLNTEKREYSSPVIEIINLDNEISLALESNPDFNAPDEVYNKPEYMNSDPYKNQNV